MEQQFKLADILADIRIEPRELGKSMAFQQGVIQERFLDMFFGFVRELAIQDKTGGYVNDNISTAIKGNAIDFLLTDNRIVR